MSKIITLDENTINKIAAGEVVERPASVIKELVENSIDAGATRITVEIKKGGITFIKISDNGSGIEEDDVVISFERHSTSKIRHSDELSSLLTLGFRGEALASIAAVSKVEMITKTQESNYGINIVVNGGNIERVGQIGAPVGTSITVRDLFYNTPARFKFLKRDSTEAGYISDIVNRIALGNPDISFKFINNGSTIIQTPGNNDLMSTIVSIYGSSVSNHLSEIDSQEGHIKLSGYAGSAEISRSNRNHQSIFINGRYIKSRLITAAIEEAYKTILMKNKFAFIVLKMDINTAEVDINVHPAKMEVRFSNENEVFRSVYNAIKSALINKSKIHEISKSTDKTDIVREDQQIFLFKENKMSNGGDLNKSDIIKNYDYTSNICNIDTSTNTDIGIDDNTNINTDKNNYTYINTNTNTNTSASASADTSANNDSNANIDANANTSEKSSYYSSIYDIEDAIIVGQVFSTYILLQKEDNLFIIDQHAAHERIIYEKLKEKYYKNEKMSQSLLAPIVIELTYQELQHTIENRQLFEKLGFIFEEFGNNSIILRCTPYKEQEGDEKELFLKLLDCISTYSGKPDDNLEENVLYQIACKAAVKANMKLQDDEKTELVKELLTLENPYTCPHGRPTIIKINKNQLEKMFKRKV